MSKRLTALVAPEVPLKQFAQTVRFVPESPALDFQSAITTHEQELEYWRVQTDLLLQRQAALRDQSKKSKIGTLASR
jgi:hypothetical protein